MNHRISPRVWALLGVGIAVVVGIGLLLAFLGREPGEPSPMITPAAHPASDDPVVASVDGRPIHQSVWMEAVLLDHVMSGLAGQPAPSPDETLHRLINEDLVLKSFPSEQEPAAGQIKTRITALEQAWSVGDAAVMAALEQVGLNRAAFERAVGRLLTVEAGMEALESQGDDPADWLEEQRASADIVINEEFLDIAVPYVPVAQSPVATPDTSPLPTPNPTAAPSILSPLPVPATEMPSPDPVVAIPEIAPDFTLERSGGGTLTLSEQLAQGPVVLIFFQRAGGWQPDPQLGELQSYYQAFQDAGAEVLSVVVTSIDVVENWCQRTGVSYPMLADPAHQVAEAYGVYNLLGDGLAAPAAFVVEPDGRVTWSYVGQRSGDRVTAPTILEHLP